MTNFRKNSYILAQLLRNIIILPAVKDHFVVLGCLGFFYETVDKHELRGTTQYIYS